MSMDTDKLDVHQLESQSKQSHKDSSPDVVMSDGEDDVTNLNIVADDRTPAEHKELDKAVLWLAPPDSAPHLALLVIVQGAIQADIPLNPKWFNPYQTTTLVKEYPLIETKISHAYEHGSFRRVRR